MADQIQRWEQEMQIMFATTTSLFVKWETSYAAREKNVPE